MVSAIVLGYVTLVENDEAYINKVPPRYLANVNAELQKRKETQKRLEESI